MTPQVREAGPPDAERVRELAGAHPFAHFRFYRRLGHDFAAEVEGRSAVTALESEGARAWLADADGGAGGAAILQPQAFERDHFGVAMARASVIADASGDRRAAIWEALLAALLPGARRAGHEHVSLRIDIEDAIGLELAQRAGFRLVDTLVTYMGRSGPPDDAGTRERFPGFSWEVLAGDALRACDPARVAHFADFMRDHYRIDRFHADRRLPAERSHDLYVEWFRRIFDGEWADGVQLVSRDERPVGFCSFQKEWEIEARHGVAILGRGLAAVLPEGKGGYALLAENISTRCPLGHQYGEFETQIRNFPVINVWSRQGMTFARALHTLHCWLDEAPTIPA